MMLAVQRRLRAMINPRPWPFSLTFSGSLRCSTAEAMKGQAADGPL